MEVRKLWSEINNSPTYFIVIDDGLIPSVNKGQYTAIIKYVGYGDDLNYFILLCSFGKYIITNQIGDKLNFSSNIPQILNSNGDYVIDRTKRPTSTATIYKGDDNEFCGVASVTKGVGSAIRCCRYKDILTKQNSQNDKQLNNRDGVLISFERYIQENINIDIFDNQEPIANANTNLLLLESERDAGIFVSDLEDEAKALFDAKNYYFKFSPSNKWDGWYSDLVTGVYSPFGDSSGNKTVGYFRYKDSLNNRYTKSFDIVERDDKWYVVYVENGVEYSSNTEPSDSNSTFINTEATPSSILLEFEAYVEYELPQIIIDTAMDLVQ